MPWTIDPAHSRIGFAVRHMMISTVRGEFTRFSGQVVLIETDPSQSQARAEIETASIDTRNADRDAHLRGADFFDAERFPTISFASRRIERQGDGFRVSGDLTMHGVTHEVTLDVELTEAATDPWGASRRGLSLTGSLNRKEFGLTWNQTLETGGVLVDEKVKLEIDLELVNAPSEEAAKLAEVEAQNAT